ncbi:hypothetical protein ACOME3_002083 [Neoechinorhynchus agilis]
MKLTDHKISNFSSGEQGNVLKMEIERSLIEIKLCPILKLNQSPLGTYIELCRPELNCITNNEQFKSIHWTSINEKAILEILSQHHSAFSQERFQFRYLIKRINRLEITYSNTILRSIISEILTNARTDCLSPKVIQNLWMSKNANDSINNFEEMINETERTIYKIMFMHGNVLQRLKLIARIDFINISPKKKYNIDAKFLKENLTRQWKMYLDFMDRLLYEAIEFAIKNSLLCVYKLFEPTHANSKQIVFYVSTELLKGKDADAQPFLKIGLCPSIDQIQANLQTLCVDQLRKNIRRINGFCCVFYEQHRKRDIAKSCVESIAVRGIQAQIQELATSYFDQVRKVFDSILNKEYNGLLNTVNLEAFTHGSSTEETNQMISHALKTYYNVQQNITSIPDNVKIGCFLFDCRTLKSKLSGLCSSGALTCQKFVTVILENVVAKVQRFVKLSTERFRYCPTIYKDLKPYSEFISSINDQTAPVENALAEIDELLNLLKKHNCSLDRKSWNQFLRLKDEWADHRKRLEDASDQEAFVKIKFRYQVEEDIECWLDQIALYSAGFEEKCPREPNMSIEKVKQELNDWIDLAMDLSHFRTHFVEALDDLDMKRTLDRTDEAFILKVEKIIEIWARKEEYDIKRKEWDTVTFGDLDMNDVEDFVTYNHKQIVAFAGSRDESFADLPVFDYILTEFGMLKGMLTALSALHNPFMQRRHWKIISSLTDRKIDHQVTSLTLSQVLDLIKENIGQVIIDVSETASKENEVEKVLNGIDQHWASTTFQIVPSGEYTSKIKMLDMVIDLAVTTQIQVSTLKGSKYAVHSKPKVEYWDRISRDVTELCDVLSNVQRRYLYLEGLFRTPDVTKEIPTEAKQFEKVDHTWLALLRIIKDRSYIPKLVESTGLIMKFKELLDWLERIQNKLEIYLETKRGLFPRFYFISDDTLVEILSLTSKPQAVQVYLKMLFDNIAALQINNGMANALVSSEQEIIPLISPVALTGNVENWLRELENSMTETVRHKIYGTLTAWAKLKKESRLNIIKHYPGQCLVTTGEIQWTSMVSNALLKSNGGLAKVESSHSSLLEEYSKMIQHADLTELDRQKLIAVVTKEVHGRDVLRDLVAQNIRDINAFEWIKQLRQYWEPFENAGEHCTIRQLNTLFRHCYEYLGCSTRLVMTPLTDRCYMTLTAALNLYLGGSPKGPAGTGKTETVKDLGKSLGVYVVVINCSEGLNYKQIGKTLSGITQSGSWGCFDEFNRINVEVLSVVAQQVNGILDGMRSGRKSVLLDEKVIPLMPSSGIFITMNPGYAGRTELPDNLKSLFRPIAMVVPDYSYIAEIFLFAEGFTNTKNLAKKVCALYQLADQQLSKQPHYDFGLRSMTSLLRYAGMKRSQMELLDDEKILEMAMTDVNVPKLTKEDLTLFNAICADIFPSIEKSDTLGAKMVSVLEKAATSTRVVATESLIKKAIQLFNTKMTRHSIMLVGSSMTGKTTCWRLLQTALNDTNVSSQIEVFKINTKAINESEMFGKLNLSSGEWNDGILSSIMRSVCQNNLESKKAWILFDGPVDAGWIENMNSLMDDNKILTLANGERILMPSDKVCLLFETEDLKVASPATVSRCGIIFFDNSDLSYKSLIDDWINKFKHV